MIAKFTAAALVAFTASASQAADINFDEFAPLGFVCPGTGSTFTSGGFDFSNSEGGTQALCSWGVGSPFQSDVSGGVSIFVNYGSTTTTMVKNGGGAFDFQSIDLADVYNQGSSVTLAFTFTPTVGSATVESVTLDSAPGLQTFVFGKTDLSSVSWVTTAGANGWSQFDNIATSPVPEPASAALMLLGVVAMGAALRRKG